MDALDPDFAAAVRTTVLTLPAAAHLGFAITDLTPGTAELRLEVRPEHTQHSGVVAGAVLGALADFAGGSAAGSLLPAGGVSMTSDYTIKFLVPAAGAVVIARGRVLKAGRTSTTAAADVLAVADGVETLCATALVGMRNIQAR